jgi:poly-beta-1,6-N-acetyl-D-glucosamine synthase
MDILVLISLMTFTVYAFLIAYYYRAWNAIPDYLPGKEIQKGKRTFISVVIPARNEAANISRCLESLSLQTYPAESFEVIVVDDNSTDETWNIIKRIVYPGLSIIPLKLKEREESEETEGKPRAFKKLALETGIGAAQGSLIVTTDADCSFPPAWLETIAGFYAFTNAKFIAAPVKIDSGNSLLSVFQTLDFITLQGITGASVFKKIHSMCNGANLAYEKKVFYEVGGFRDIDHIPSGDDMLLMHKIYKKYPLDVLFLKSRDATVSTMPEKSWMGFINQRIRWASKADSYEDKRIFRVLLLVYLFNLLFVCLALASFRSHIYLFLFILLLLLKTIIEYPFVRKVAVFFNQQGLLVYFPFFQPLHILYTIVIGWMGKFGSYRWKERKVNKTVPINTTLY